MPISYSFLKIYNEVQTKIRKERERNSKEWNELEDFIKNKKRGQKTSSWSK